MLKLRCSSLFAVAIVAALTGQAPAQPKTPLRVEDLYLFDAPKSPLLLPDGKRAVYVRNWIDADSKHERNSLWIVEGAKDKARPLEPGEPDARAPVVSPDGKWIAFLTTNERRPILQNVVPPPSVPAASDPPMDLWMISTAGGEAIPLAFPKMLIAPGGIGVKFDEPRKPYGRIFNDGFYGRVAFSPDGKKIVFVADDGSSARTPQEVANNVTIVRPDQGEGYTGYGPAQIWIAELDDNPRRVAAKTIERLTNDDVWYGDPQWSPDGKTLAVHANKTRERESVRYSINRNFDIWAIDVATKKQTQLTTGPGPEVSPRWSPDGKRIACLSVPRKGSHRDVFNLAIVTPSSNGSQSKVVFDHHGPNADKPPHRPPTFPLPSKCWLDRDNVVYTAEVGVRTETMRLNVAGGTSDYADVDPLTAGPGEQPGQRLRLQLMLPAGNVILKERLTAEGRRIAWLNDEKATIDGILTTPPAEIAKPPYKLILYPHGGPHSRSALGFDFTVQVFAAHGYAVFQPNFRGSHGYGQKFIDADRGDFGGGDMRDILTGIDHLVKEKLVDPKRQFVYGSSYGGFMTTWLVGQTKQFRAAVAQNAVTDLHMMWGLSDLQSWVEWEFGLPWQVPDKLRKHSPLTYADKVETPTLILHSRDDRRCPLPMGKAYHQALLARGVPTQMVIYPDEGHGIRQPRHREDVLRRVLGWFAKYDVEEK
ncbi:MAG: S9 family peptidase [Gemmataceae bacterium]|nr:S9 family peptidase [Gemmataceae bacterium]